MQLTKSIEATNTRIILDVSDDFDLTTWLEGFVSFDSSILSDTPGVDTDRRILRLAFFAALAWEYSLKSGAWEKRESRIPTSANEASERISASADDPQERAVDEATDQKFRKGSKVVIVGLKCEELRGLKNGMTGKVLNRIDKDTYSVSFRNLAHPLAVHRRNIKRITKANREDHQCQKCEKTADFFCRRCSIAWYCSPECQKTDYENHKKICKLFASEHPFFDMIQQERGKK